MSVASSWNQLWKKEGREEKDNVSSYLLGKRQNLIVQNIQNKMECAEKG